MNREFGFAQAHARLAWDSETPLPCEKRFGKSLLKLTSLYIYILCSFPHDGGSNEIKAQNKVVGNPGYVPDMISLGYFAQLWIWTFFLGT